MKKKFILAIQILFFLFLFVGCQQGDSNQNNTVIQEEIEQQQPYNNEDKQKQGTASDEPSKPMEESQIEPEAPEVKDEEENSSSLKLQKAVSGTLNIRSIPDHEGQLVGTVTNDQEVLLFNGKFEHGYGSDGAIHDWCYITTESGISGWVREDLVTADGKSVKSAMGILQYYRKEVEGTLNIRSEPKHDSELVGTVESQYEPLKFYGEIGTGMGSDGQMHEWYKITTEEGVTGWVRSDYIWKEQG